MYTEVGSFDAKAKLSALLREVEHGQCYTITLRGRPIADLVPSGSRTQQNARAAVEAMHNINKIQNISQDTLLEWIAEGRR